MKQFPEVIKYLSRNVVHSVRREHFSFSPRMPVGDFFEERDTPEGLQWVQLSAEEIPSRIQAITGKRGRPRNNEKAKNKEVPKVKRGRGRPPKIKMPELLNKTDNRLPKKLETQEILSEDDKAKMTKNKKKMRQKVQRGESQTPVQGQARNKRKQDTKSLKQKDTKKKLKVCTRIHVPSVILFSQGTLCMLDKHSTTELSSALKSVCKAPQRFSKCTVSVRQLDLGLECEVLGPGAAGRVLTR